MARVTHVKKAQQRYHTKPVIDPATGEQKQVPVMNSRGEQKATKGGRPVFLRITEKDLSRPKPLLRCDYSGCAHEGREIALGSPYKWVEPQGRGMMARHADCPTWQQWELSNSLSARVAQIQDGDPDPVEVEDPDSIKGWLESKAEAIRELAEEKRESASNIEEGFGHPVQASEELSDIADQLDGWADELEQVDVPELPEPEEQDCDECGGTGKVEASDGEADGHQAVDEGCDGPCDGSGRYTPDEPTDEQMDTWREEAIQAARDALDNCPV